MTRWFAIYDLDNDGQTEIMAFELNDPAENDSIVALRIYKNTGVLDSPQWQVSEAVTIQDFYIDGHKITHADELDLFIKQAQDVVIK